MTRLNKGGTTPLVTQPMATRNIPTGKTNEGAPGYERDARTELFLRATTVFAGEGQFYEDAQTADQRAVELVRKLAIEDWKWVAGFLPWLRSQGNIRTSAVMLACQAAEARTKVTPEQHFKNPSPYYMTLTPREVVNVVLMRGDEPTEALQYCKNTFGRIPQSVKRGVADAMIRLWGERSVIRYDKDNRPLRFADAIELVHARPKADWQSDLFRYLLDQRHHPNDDEIPMSLQKHRARRGLSVLAPDQRHAIAAAALAHRDQEMGQIADAACGQWEWVMSWLGEGANGLGSALTERQRWELVIPEMGYMALIRNLRNFEQAGIKPEMVKWICDKISDPKEVANSRQFPFRFLSAYLNTHGAQWLPSLEQALTYSTGNIPVLDGNTHILVDCSGSMARPLSQPRVRKDGTAARVPTREQAAQLFGLALAMRNAGKSELYLFANRAYGPIFVHQGASVLRAMDEVMRLGTQLGGGTALEQNIRLTFDPAKHTRSVIITDEQAAWDGGARVMQSIPAHIPAYLFNLAGYQFGAEPLGKNRVGLGGLTDSSFGLLSRYEAAQTGLWPWQYETHQAPVDDE